MAAGIQVIRVSLTVTVTLSPAALRREMGDMVPAIGPNLARQVDAWVRRERLGYYPALDFFRDGEAVEPELLAAAEHVSWLVCEHVRKKIRTQLREPFSNVRFEKIQSLAYSMPRVRPQEPGALETLADHYTPGSVRLVLTASSIERGNLPRDGYEHRAAVKVRRWLEEVFSGVDISDTRVLG